MVLEELRLENVRCHRRLRLGFGAGLNLIVGPNGAGKTTVLEAIHVLFRGWSPRTPSVGELVGEAGDIIRIESRARTEAGEARDYSVGYDLRGGRRISMGQLALRDFSRLEAEQPILVFLPDDLLLIKGGPRRRRRHLDRVAAEQEPGYKQVLDRYQEALSQRNSLLRQGILGEENAPWETLLAREGLALVHARARLLAGLQDHFSKAYSVLSGEPAETVAIVYRTNVSELDEKMYRHRLAEQRQTDRVRTFTNLGPHRDDFRISLRGRDLRDFGSQGEQRTAVLAVVLGERATVRERTGKDPLLLLDDVMSELDAQRRRALVEMLAGSSQVILTTTNLEYFSSEHLAGATVVELAGRGEVADAQL